jgi:hypothetical protein
MPMKRLPLVVFAAFGLLVAACGGGGGGGGDEEAFCDALESISDQVANGDLADDEGLEDVTDTVNDLLEAADDGEQLDAVNAVGDEVEGADPDDANDTAETIQDELGDFAEGCEIDEDEFAVAPEVEEEETTTTTEDGGDTTDTTAGGDTTDTTAGGGGDLSNINVGARQPVPAGIEAEFAGAAEQCFNGDAPVCDNIFNQSPPGSVAEQYGATCGGRVAEGGAGVCAQLITAPETPPTDIADQGLAAACFDGDMNACDDLFNSSAEGSTDELYGALCGFRVQTTDAFCVDIFGDEALF